MSTGLGPFRFERTTEDGGRLWHCGRGGVWLAVDFALPRGFLRPFRRHARAAPGAPPTFPHLTFAASPSGLRVDPWPGWRGIPDLPPPEFAGRRGMARGRWMFQGDEEEAGRLRAVFPLQEGWNNGATLRVPNPRLRPLAAALFGPPPPARMKPRRRRHPPGTHPRLLFGPDAVPALRAKFAADAGGEASRWRDVLRGWSLPFATSPESKARPGPGRLSPEDRVLVSARTGAITPRPIPSAARSGCWPTVSW